MPAIEDHSFLKICAQIASHLSISISAARRKVDLLASKQGIKDPVGRKNIAQKLLDDTKSLSAKDGVDLSAQLDQLLTALSEDENFMVED